MGKCTVIVMKIETVSRIINEKEDKIPKSWILELVNLLMSIVEVGMGEARMKL